MIKFGQGSGRRTSTGEILASDNHITCYSVACLNLETREAALFHVWEGMYSGLSDRQKEVLQAFATPLGRKVAFIVEGGCSTPSGNGRDMLRSCGVEILKVYEIRSKNARWNAEFDPAQRTLTISDEYGKIYLDHKVVFPDFTPVPAEEAGLSGRQRLIHRLGRFTNARTGAFTADTLAVIRTIMDREHIGHSFTLVDSKLIHDFVNARARKAGYENYHDYWSADENAFAKVEKDSLELVLRKIIGMPENARKRFNKAGINFRTVRVTPDSVVDLLADYPILLQKIIMALSEDQQKRAQSKAAAPVP